jgi:hypothetical protein
LVDGVLLMRVVWANLAKTTLAAPITNSATTATLFSGTGALFPSPGAGEFFPLTFITTDLATNEIVYCTARSGDTVTITRAREGTTGLAWNAGDLAQHLVTAGTLALLGNNFTNYQTFISSGTWTTPTGVSLALVTCLGGGGGGANCQATSLAQDASGGGGGAGAFVTGIYSVSGAVTVTVGAGGAAQANGSASLFGGFCIANGGGGAVFQTAASSAGAIGGLAVGGTIINAVGGWGSDGQSGSFVFAGNGADGPWGGSGRAGNHAGQPATGRGAGGGGAYDSGLTGTLYPGGAGGDGIVIVQW